MNKRAIFAMIISLFCVYPALSQQLSNTYLNGVYYNDQGQPELPAFLSTSDTSFLMFNMPEAFYWPTGLTKESENFYWLADYNPGQSKLRKVFYRMDDQYASVLNSYDSPLLGYAGLTYDGEDLWAVYENQYRLYRIDNLTGVTIDSFALPLPDSLNPDRHAWGIAYDGEYLWHSQYGENSIIYKLDPSNAAIVDSIIPTAAMLLGLAYENPFLYGIDIQNGLIYRFNPQTLSEVDNYDWDIGYPLGLHYDSEAGNFINVSGKTDYGGDEAVYMVGITVGIDEPYSAVPSSVELLSAYPNPFNATTSISFTLIQPSQVTLDIYDILGRRAESLVDEFLPAGNHSVLWQAGEMTSGIYFYRLTAGEYQDSRKITLLK